MFIDLNRDYVSSETYMNNYSKYKYNSFILGSSRTIAFSVESWKQYLQSSAIPFHFDASGENFFGIYTKIKYLDKTGVDLKNCLIIVCSDNTFNPDNVLKGHLYMKHPTIAGTSWYDFYLTALKDYFDFKFLLNYYYYITSGKTIPSMKGYIIFNKFKNKNTVSIVFF